MQVIEPFDIVVIVLMIGMTVRGGLSGIVGQVMSILSILLSWYIASRYFDIISGYLPKENSWNEPVSIFVMFVLCNIVIRIAAFFIQKTVKFGPLKEFDRQLGAILGMVKGLLLCLVVTFFAVTLTQKSRDAVAQSQSGKYLVSTLMYITNIVPDDSRHAAFKKELAKFATIVNDSGMATTSITDDVAKLKQDLKKQVILPDAEKQLAQENANGTTASKTVAATPKTKQSATGGQTDTSTSSFLSGIDSFFSSLTSPRTGTNSAGSQTATAVNSTYSAPGNSDSASDSTLHPLESLASNFSGFSGNLSMGDATISVNVPGQGSGEPLVADVRFPDLESELSKRAPVQESFSVPLTSGGVVRNTAPAAGNRSNTSQNYTSGATTTGTGAVLLQDDQRIYSGSIMYQPTFSPSSVAPPPLGQ